MAAGLGLTAADVTTPAGSFERVSVNVRGGTGVLRRGREVVAEMAVATVNQTARRAWLVVGVDGSEWVVTKRGCGCGGGR